MSYIPLEQAALDQLSRSTSAYLAFVEAADAEEKLRHSFRWASEGSREVLHRVNDRGEFLASLGPRTVRLEQVVSKHERDKESAIRTLQSARAELETAQRLNVANGIARVPGIVISVLEAFWKRSLMDFFTVIGTHALYAYEAAAGVMFDADATSTRDVDLLMDVQQRMKLLRIAERDSISILDVLKEADHTFERAEDQLESAVNATAFYVDFLRRQEPEKYTDPYPASGREGDVYPVQAPRSQDFLSSPRFEQVVIGEDGRMTLMRTVDPRTFVEFKLWMSDQTDREYQKRRRDRMQAQEVQRLLDERRLKSKLM